jgi:hypothetical protein
VASSTLPDWVRYGLKPSAYTIYADPSGNVFAEPSRESGAPSFPAGPDVVTVTNKALAQLSAGRTWKERVALKGTFTVPNGSTILQPSYSILDLTGARLIFATALGQTLIQNSDLVNGNTDLQVEGGIIDGLQGTDITGLETSNAIVYQKVKRFKIDHVQWRRFSGEGVFLGVSGTNNTGCSYGEITNCIMDDGTVAGFVAVLGASTKIGIDYNHIFDWDASVTVYNGTKIHIAHNDFAQRGPSIEITPQVTTDICQDITVEDNFCEPSLTRGIWLHHNNALNAGTMSRIDCIRNHVLSPPFEGLRLDTFGSAIVDKIRFLRNVVVNPGTQGIFIPNSSTTQNIIDSDFSGNIITGAGGSESMRLIGLQDSRVNDNRIEGGIGAGIDLLSISAGVISKYNHIKNNTVKNTTGAQGYGIVENSFSNFNQYIGNILVGNAQGAFNKGGAGNSQFAYNEGDLDSATGAGAQALGAANCPAVTPGAVNTWIKVIDGSNNVLYVPAWK